MNLESIVNLPGWCTVEKAKVLFDLAHLCKSKVSLELGVFGGRSLIAIALAHQQMKSGFVIGVDAWSKQASVEGTNDKANDEWWSNVNYLDIYKSCLQAIDDSALNDYCGTVRMKSQDVGILMRENYIDLLHQDSNHSEEVTCVEVELFASKVKENGYWISDDTDWSTTQKSQGLLLEKGFRLVADHTTYKVFQKA